MLDENIPPHIEKLKYNRGKSFLQRDNSIQSWDSDNALTDYQELV